MRVSTTCMGIVGSTNARTRGFWLVMVGTGLCTVLGLLAQPDVSWARPKKNTYWSCKCACRWVDELGKEHFGPSGAVQFTESSLEACLGHSCTASTPTGTHQGTTRDCMGTEQQSQMRLPPGGVQGQLQPVPSPQGRMPVPAPGGPIMRRGVEGDQPTSSEKEGK